MIYPVEVLEKALTFSTKAFVICEIFPRRESVPLVSVFIESLQYSKLFILVYDVMNQCASINYE